jgi:DNA-binding transcriptional regulator YiaG
MIASETDLRTLNVREKGNIMPNVAKVLREEITRLARKEAKAAVAPIRRPSIRLRKDAADLKRRMASLEKETKRLQALLNKMEAAQPAVPDAEKKAWISGKGIKSLRKRLGLSQAELAKLVGVSDNAVYIWESKPGMLKLRPSTKAAVFSIRGIGAREAKKRLEEMKKKTPRKPRKVVSKRGRGAKARRSRK